MVIDENLHNQFQWVTFANDAAFEWGRNRLRHHWYCLRILLPAGMLLFHVSRALDPTPPRTLHTLSIQTPLLSTPLVVCKLSSPTFPCTFLVVVVVFSWLGRISCMCYGGGQFELKWGLHSVRPFGWSTNVHEAKFQQSQHFSPNPAWAYTCLNPINNFWLINSLS